jgi:hypothetical protein
VSLLFGPLCQVDFARLVVFTFFVVVLAESGFEPSTGCSDALINDSHKSATISLLIFFLARLDGGAWVDPGGFDCSRVLLPALYASFTA